MFFSLSMGAMAIIKSLITAFVGMKFVFQYYENNWIYN